ncbi:PIN2/TERF1-interacting telomerase inhibitor 1 [Triplophysa rosa]|uniref:PIN2/TERF1-interacting telomerase inhibitor 1 n=1 Tax=Triplophysa rosa TaxID=992332 RepID=A0A9W7TPG1_TRIRA|nr:PIN2/TERF1-interacting telomerase inhibitor 1 [Triplophysa rosa]KAI7799599.1 putative PIN2/TERF1-interacting telomerase inhibitor 1 [Triplophysa rosa]
MSMLAEPRRKQKWSVDPRNSAWSNDESKFGQKMLERMGWSKGKGLGKSQQGSTEHIKVKVKNNTQGLGTSISNEDNWIAHQDDFNQLLADLNSCHGQNNTEKATEEQSQNFSLEEKSKTSKKRVHYMKFTKGKDLSNRSETDLACIFGKRSKRKAKDKAEGSSGPDSQEERESENDTENNPNPEAQQNTVTSTLTMQEYFAQRMAQLKRAQVGDASAASSPGVSSNAPSSPASTEDSANASDMEQSKKKKKKRKQENRDDTEEKEEDVALTPVTEKGIGESRRSKKKQKKSKREESSTPAVMNGVTEEEASIPEKRQKTSPEIQTETADEHLVVENVDSEVSAKKKKKRKQEQTE